MNDSIKVIFAGLVLLAVIAAVAVLTWHGDVSGEAAMTFFGGLGIGGGTAVVSHVSTSTGAKAATGRLPGNP